MSDWPVVDAGFEVLSVNFQPTEPTSANTKGDYYEVVSSTTSDINYFILMVRQTDYLQIGYLLDIAVGAEGYEEIIAADLSFSNGTSGYERQHMHHGYAVPIHIPAGSRISVRYQATRTEYINLQLQGYSSLFGLGSGFSGVVTLGADTANSAGTSVDPGGTADTYGLWTEFSSAVDTCLKSIIIVIPFNGDTGRITANWYLDVGVGASGSEQAIISEYNISCRDTDDDPSPKVSHILPVTVPEGTRLSVRLKCSITDSAGRLLDVIIYGVY